MIVKDENFLSTNQLECIDHIKETVTKSRGLLERILSAKEQCHRVPQLNLERVDLCELAKNSIQSFSSKASKKDIKIHFKIHEKKLNMLTDAMLVNQIFQNIISNSLKFSPNAGSVNVLVEKLYKSVKVEFLDQGPGFDQEEVDQLFGKYTRLSSTPTNGESSSGLGLSLVNRYVKQLGGSIWYENSKDKGANFILLLPIG